MKKRSLGPVIIATICLLLFASAASARSPDLSRVRTLMDQQHYQQALTTVNHFLARKGHSDDARARFLKGLALTNLGRTQTAEKVFQGLTKDYPKLPEPYNNLAVIYARQGNYEAAEKELKAAIATHPSYATAQENLGDIYAARASQAYDKALSLNKGNKQLQLKLNLLDRLNSLSAQNAGTPQPSAAAQPAKTAAAGGAAPAPGEKHAVREAVLAWAQAWEHEKLNQYLDAYGPDFRPPHNLTRQQWRAQRHKRVSQPRHIHITLNHMQITLLDPRSAEATFTQHYRSGYYSDRVVKMLVMHKVGGEWKIQRETVLRKLSS